MRNYFKSLKTNAGFTLIELLVVIGILGVLAAALIATIDPFEQLKKADDANYKNTTVEFVNASIRYYTTHTKLPWADQASGTDCYNGGALPVQGQALDGTRMDDCLNALINDGELKSSFTSVNFLDKIFVSGTDNSVITCFLPTSKSQQRDLNTKYDINGVEITDPDGSCVGKGSGTTLCYWCSL